MNFRDNPFHFEHERHISNFKLIKFNANQSMTVFFQVNHKAPRIRLFQDLRAIVTRFNNENGRDFQLFRTKRMILTNQIRRAKSDRRCRPLHSGRCSSWPLSLQRRATHLCNGLSSHQSVGVGPARPKRLRAHSRQGFIRHTKVSSSSR